MERPNEELRRGRRALSMVPGVEVLSDWTWYAASKSWQVRCRLCLQPPPGSPVAADTDWDLRVSPSYPHGNITCWPAPEGGLVGTYPHQLPPTLGGRVSVTANYGRQVDPSEPADVTRLAWYGERLMLWLREAAAGTLQRPGDPYWLPLPSRSVAQTLVCQEGPEHLPAWQASARWGRVHLRKPSVANLPWVITDFFDAAGDRPQGRRWGSFVGHLYPNPPEVAAWLCLDRPPLLPSGQLPETGAELMQVLDEQGLGDCLRRPMTSPRHLLLGAPVPERVGEPPKRLHFWAIELAEPLGYLHVQNWHPDQLNVRGQFSKAVRERPVLLIGAGALGSAVAEFLVRGGLRRLRIVDRDVLEGGNLVRHTGLLHEIGMPKAKLLSLRLGLASPHAVVDCVADWYAQTVASPVDFPVVLDTTGNDEVLHELAQAAFPEDRLVVSLAVSVGAWRLFAYASWGVRFSAEDFRRQVTPELTKETDTPYGEGCHAPTFPARMDEVWQLAAQAIPLLSAWMKTPPAMPQLRVLERG